MNFLDALGQWIAATGFAGLATIIAALLALVAMQRQSVVRRMTQDRELWWRQAEWALTLAVTTPRRGGWESTQHPRSRSKKYRARANEC